MIMKGFNNIGVVAIIIFCCSATVVLSQENTKKVKKNEVITLEDLPETITIVLLTPSEADQLKQEGENAMASKNFSKAIEKFLILTQASEESPDDHYSLAVAYDSAANYSSSLKHYQIVLQLDPKNFEALNSIGLIYCNRMDEPEEALDFYEGALTMLPAGKKTFTYIHIAKAYQKLGDNDNARQFFTKATQENIAVDLAWTQFAEFELSIANYPKALEYFGKAKNLAGDEGISYLNIAKVYEAMNDNKTARQQMEWALDNLPDYKLGNLSYHYAMFLQRQFPNEKSLAKMSLLNEFNSSSPHPDSWRQLAILLTANKDWAMLKTAFNEHLSAYENIPDFNYYLGLAYFNLGDKEAGTSLLKKAENMGSEKANAMINENNL